MGCNSPRFAPHSFLSKDPNSTKISHLAHSLFRRVAVVLMHVDSNEGSTAVHYFAIPRPSVLRSQLVKRSKTSFIELPSPLHPVLEMEELLDQCTLQLYLLINFFYFLFIS